MFSPILMTFLPLSLSLLTFVFKFPRVNELGSSTLLLDDIAYEKTPLSLVEFNKNSGLFLIHQEIDSAQHKIDSDQRNWIPGIPGQSCFLLYFLSSVCSVIIVLLLKRVMLFCTC